MSTAYAAQVAETFIETPPATFGDAHATGAELGALRDLYALNGHNREATIDNIVENGHPLPANIIAENTGLLVSSRQLNFLNPSINFGYGFDPEKAWNYGINFIHNFKLIQQNGSISIDAYRTVFTNQVVVDLDAQPQTINLYNLTGKSFSNSIQAEINYEPIKKLEVRLAYRWLDVQTTYHNRLLDKPLVAKHRAFINVSYETTNKWKIDMTTQWLSKKRLPTTLQNPTAYQLPAYSAPYLQVSGQVTKQFGHHWDIYLGIENLTNFTQENLFISGNQPFSPYFDGSIVWGPINGRLAYIGFRLKLQ